MMPEIVLEGCAPVPLAAYLKALGVFRLVAEQKDPGARGFWRNESFVLDTVLTQEDLLRFFLEDYRPSPIISPWNAGSGFYYQEGKLNEKDPKTGKKKKTGVRNQPTAATRTVDLISESRSNQRLFAYKQVIQDARSVLTALGYDSAPSENGKRQLVTLLRGHLSDSSLPWFDAAVIMSGNELTFPPLLGSGGNDGNLDFSTNFMQRLIDLLDVETGQPRPGVLSSLQNALFGNAAISVGKGAVGQFAPGAAGGPNATAGFDRDTLINPWDYVLMLEGALMFAASVTRRLQGEGLGALSFPFTVRTTGTGGAGASLTEENDARGEIWLPLWQRSAVFAEITALLSEGRATLDRRSVRDGMDFARAVAALGVNRGVAEFQRVAFLQRSGKSYVAAPVNRVRVRRNPKADLLNDLDREDWLPRFRRYARTKEAPARLQAIARRIDEAIFVLTQERAESVSASAVQRVLMALGEAVAYLASSPKARDSKGANLRPPPPLDRAWFEAANDRLPEFRIAAALAGIGIGMGRREADGPDETAESASAQSDPPVDENGGPTMGDRKQSALSPPFRAHLVPLDEKTWHGRYRKWSDAERLAVWGHGALERNLAAVLDRRLLYAARNDLAGGPFSGQAAADLSSVLAFLHEKTDDAKIAALAKGLAWASPPYLIKNMANQRAPMPLAYALMKPFFVPDCDLGKIGTVPTDMKLRMPSGLVRRLNADDVGAAVALACRAARAAGLPVTFQPATSHGVGLKGPRLLASLMIPIQYRDLERVLERAYPALFEDVPRRDKEKPADAA